MTPVRRRLRSPPGDAAFAASLFLCCLLLGSAVPAPAAPGLQPGRLLAQLVPREFATLSAEVAGRIEHIGAREGEPFRRGDRLFTIDCDRERAQRARAEAQRTLARVAHEGNQHLARLDAVGSVELAETAAQLAVAEAEIRYLDVTLRKCEVTAPWDGVAGAWHVRPLEYVQAGQPVLDIHDPDGLQVEFIVPTAWLSWLTPGDALSIDVEELGREVPLVLRRLAARADPVSQSVKAIADVVDPGEGLIAGMSGTLRIAIPAQPVTQRGNADE